MHTGLLASLESLPRRPLLFGTAGLLLLVAGLVWGVLPLYEYKSELIQRQEQTRELLQEVSRLRHEYRQGGRAAASEEAAGSGLSGFSLFSFVENQAGRDGIKEHIASMRPSTVETPDGPVERQVQLRLEESRLVPLLRFLEHIEYAGERIYVKRLTIRSPRENPGNLRVDLLLAAFE